MLDWHVLLDTLGSSLSLAAVPLGLGMMGSVRGPVPDDMDRDSDLVVAVRKGDATAYRGLVEKYQGRVYNVIYGMVRNREDARDLTQETFVKAYRNLHAFREDARFYTWIYRIAMNLSIDFLRRRQRGPLTGMDEGIAGRDADGQIHPMHGEDGPRRLLERKRLYSAIMDAVEELPEQQRQVILLREVEGLSYKEIADVLDIAEGTVMSRLFYARKRLQATLAPVREEEG
jgi:RNA polymerase sigma-70 factor (ECF subfamily)